jgi:splicing factor 3B subunit 2
VVIETVDIHQPVRALSTCPSRRILLYRSYPEAFSELLSRFQSDTEDTPVRGQSNLFSLADLFVAQVKSEDPPKGEVIYSDDVIASEKDSEVEGEKKPFLKEQQRKLNRLTVAELKQLVSQPEVVERTDVSAADSDPRPHSGPLECQT